MLKYRDYTIRRSNLIENEGATSIRRLSTSIHGYLSAARVDRSASPIAAGFPRLKSEKSVSKSAYLYLTFPVVRSVFSKSGAQLERRHHHPTWNHNFAEIATVMAIAR